MIFCIKIFISICFSFFGNTIAYNYEFPDINMKQFREVWKHKEHHYYSMQLNGEHFLGTRPWHIRWEKIKQATTFDEKRILDVGTSVGLCPLFISRLFFPKKMVAFDNERNAVDTATNLKKIFNIEFDLYLLNLDEDPYEEVLGYEYDVVICMSVLNWIKNKQRLLNYLGCFKELIFEGHDSISTETDRLRRVGFRHFTILGPTDRNRHLLYCTK